MTEIITLLIIFQFKHFLADFPLQGKYMLGKFKDKGWILPLASHCLVHGIMTLIIILAFNPGFWWLCLVDFILHFTMDRIKASKKLLGRFTPEQPYFWWSLGFDQMFHHFTHYLIIWILVV